MVLTRAAVIAAVVLGTAAGARADRVERGVVVGVDKDAVYIDVPRTRGAAAGRPLRFKRRIELRHPVTGRVVSDELPIGDTEVSISDAGATLSRAVVPPALAALLRTGDIAEVRVPAPAEAPPPPPPEAPAAALDDDTAAVLRLWRASAGHPLGEQIAGWERFLADHPGTRYAGALRQDLELLRAALAAVQPDQADTERLREPTIGGVEHAAAPSAPGGQPLALAFLTRVELSAAWLHYRTAGSEAYRRIALRRDGDAYLRGEIPGTALHAPGVEYFVEAADTSGHGGAAIGTADAPLTVRVEPPPATRWFTGRHHRSRVSTSATYLDYASFDNRSGDHTDRSFLVETDFLYRLDAGPLHGVRSGFGVLQGEGGYIAAPPPGEDPEHAGFTYGYVEAELRSNTSPVGLLVRGIAGLGDDGLGFGAEGRVRAGAEESTNVAFAVSSLADIGFLSEIRMQFVAVPPLPIGLAVALTDQPNRGDLGVRMSVDAGWRALSWMTPMVRVSYQGRTVRHSGVGGGLSLVFDW